MYVIVRTLTMSFTDRTNIVFPRESGLLTTVLQLKTRKHKTISSTCLINSKIEIKINKKPPKTVMFLVTILSIAFALVLYVKMCILNFI